MIERCPSHIIDSELYSPSIIASYPQGYGLLYSTAALGITSNGQPYNGVHEHRIIPSGWRLPTLDDVNALKDSAGYQPARKLKIRTFYDHPSIPDNTKGVDNPQGLWLPYSDPLVITHPSWKYERNRHYVVYSADYFGLDTLGFRATPAGYINYFNAYAPIGGIFLMWVNYSMINDYSLCMRLDYRDNSINTRNMPYVDGVSVRFCRNKGSNPSTGTITDPEGNVYSYVTIGNRQWITTNWKSRKYNNGDWIRDGNNMSDWIDAGKKINRDIIVSGETRTVVSKRQGVWSHPKWVNTKTMEKLYPN